MLAGDNFPDFFTNLFTAREMYNKQFDILTVTATPDANSIPQGGMLGLYAAATNNTGDLLSIQGWSEVIFPDGRFISPLQAGEEINLGPEEMMVKRTEHDIPQDAPLGGPYTYCISVGEFPDFIYDQDCFEFEIVTTSE